MATALDIIKRSMRIVGALAAGATPTSDEQTDFLATLNTMLDGMNNDGGLIYQIQEQNFALTSGTGSYTIGSGATFDTTRPVKIERAWTRDSSGADFDLTIIEFDLWADITSKSAEGDIPEFLYYSPGFANGTIYLNPEPGTGRTLYLNTWKVLASIASTGTTVTLPPGYQEMLEYNLADRIAPEFGTQLTPSAERRRQTLTRAIRKMNSRTPTLSTQIAAMTARQSYDITTGE